MRAGSYQVCLSVACLDGEHIHACRMLSVTFRLSISAPAVRLDDEKFRTDFSEVVYHQQVSVRVRSSLFVSVGVLVFSSSFAGTDGTMNSCNFVGHEQVNSWNTFKLLPAIPMSPLRCSWGTKTCYKGVIWSGLGKASFAAKYDCRFSRLNLVPLSVESVGLP